MNKYSGEMNCFPSFSFSSTIVFFLPQEEHTGGHLPCLLATIFLNDQRAVNENFWAGLNVD
jgi:hypothetical protein